MVTRYEIENQIEKTKDHLHSTIDKIADVIHEETNVKKKIEENPYKAAFLCAGIGLLIGASSSSLGKGLLKIALQAGTAIIGAYVSKQGVDYLTNKMRTEDYTQPN